MTREENSMTELALTLKLPPLGPKERALFPHCTPQHHCTCCHERAAAELRDPKDGVS